MRERVPCPSCAKSLFKRSSSRPSIDRPFEECPHCKAVVAQEHCNEWDFLGPGERAGHYGRVLLAALAFGLIAALAYTARDAVSGTAPNPLHTLIAFAAGALSAGSIAGALLSHRIKQSRHRLSDPMYRSALMEFELSTVAKQR